MSSDRNQNGSHLAALIQDSVSSRYELVILDLMGMGEYGECVGGKI